MSGKLLKADVRCMYLSSGSNNVIQKGHNMTKRLLKVLGISAALAASFSMSAFAEEITSVSFAAGCDTDASLSAGNTDPTFVVNDTNAEYELSSYSATSDTTSYKTAKVYELTFEANSGYTFPSSANSITVTGKGITEITKKTVDSDTTLIVKVKAYPYHMWDAPSEPAETLNSSEKVSKYTWNKNGAPTTEYIFAYVNTSGETKYVHGTTSSSSYSVPSAARATASDSQKEDGKDDASIVGFTIRVKGNAGSNPYTAPSDWVGDTSLVDEYSDSEIESYESWGDLFEGVTATSGSGSSAKSGSGSSTQGPGQTLNGWVGSDEKWYYYQNGKSVKGWYNDNGTWYYLNPVTGLMETGWVIDNSKRYYLNPNHGGPLGAMMTGTQTIDGQTYNLAASGEVQ